MRFTAIVAALALAGAIAPAVAHADDPTDATMRDPAARAADHDATARLNAGQLAYVQQRDAGYARQRSDGSAGGWHTPPQDDTAYADARSDYARRLASWRAQVAACQNGEWSACQQ